MLHDELIPVNLETSYLHLITNSATGSDDKTLIVYYSDEEGEEVGGIGIWFTSPMRYGLMFCQDEWTTFPLRVPTEQDKLWRIEKRGYRTLILCNNQLVLDMTASSETCNNSYWTDTWATYWGREVTNIKFPSEWNSATALYYVGELNNVG